MCHRPRLELCNEYWVVNFIETNNSQVDLYFPSFLVQKVQLIAILLKSLVYS